MAIDGLLIADWRIVDWRLADWRLADWRLTIDDWAAWSGRGTSSSLFRDLGSVVPQRQIIVNIATSADSYVARPDGDLEWLTEPAPKGFYGLPEFERSTDARILGRKTFDWSLQMGARFSAKTIHYVFSRRPPPASVPAGVHFVTEPIRAFADRLRAQPGKNVWMMGGGGIIGSFLDEDAIDEFIITVVPTFIGEGIPLLAPRHRAVALRLLDVRQFPDGAVQLHYEVQRSKV